MRVTRWRSRIPQVAGLCTVLFIMVLWLLKSKLNAPFVEGPLGALKRYRNMSRIPELTEGFGNFESPDEAPRIGPGEGGRAHNLRPEQEDDANESIDQYGMSVACSDEISLDRSVPDLRHEECKHWNYPENLPKVSVVIVFHNEGFSILMRTVHSVVNRSPPQFIEEIILVDDFSDKEDLKDNLESYIQRWGGKVRLFRNVQREGLINARSRGAREAQGEIIVFLDAHCEVMKNWLPPLITPIYNNRTTMTVPIIEVIDNQNFEIRKAHGGSNYYRGTFEWGLQYRENIVPVRILHHGRTHHTDPYRSPTHAGGLLAINREYFFELGLYDPGLLVWGGEQFELSFKVWQCGGSLLYVPCSRVAHVYKTKMPFTLGELDKNRKGSLFLGNYKRVVETWMDEKYKEYFYIREPVARYVDMGDIGEQLKLKEKLQCRSFQWYMDNVAFDVLIMNPAPPPNKHWGYLKNIATQFCIGPTGEAPATMVASTCNSEVQILRLNVRGQLAIGEYCVRFFKPELKYVNCMIGTVEGQWRYNETTKVVFHKGEGKCMAVDSEQLGLVSLIPCEPENTHQQWLFIDVSHSL